MSFHPKPHRPAHWWISEEERTWLIAMRAAKVCSDKKDYLTYEEALRVAIFNTSKVSGVPLLRVYRCNVCPHFHLTKHPQ